MWRNVVNNILKAHKKNAYYVIETIGFIKVRCLRIFGFFTLKNSKSYIVSPQKSLCFLLLLFCSREKYIVKY